MNLCPWVQVVSSFNKTEKNTFENDQCDCEAIKSVYIGDMVWFKYISLFTPHFTAVIRSYLIFNLYQNCLHKTLRLKEIPHVIAVT